MRHHTCRSCSSVLTHCFVDLGVTPFANRFLAESQLDDLEPFCSLKTYVCEHCFLVQVPALATPEDLFQDYHYRSSFSQTWLDHCANYANEMEKTYNLTQDSFVIEIASNDGCLLSAFKDKKFNILGIEPAENIAILARDNDIPTVSKFFGAETASTILKEYGAANLMTANNVLAHVPDIHDFVEGFKILLNENGAITIEFPHLLNLIEQKQFDTIYHEHYSYLSLTSLKPIFEAHKLEIVHAETLATHGGSLRIHICHQEESTGPSSSLQKLFQIEFDAGFSDLKTYTNFQKTALGIKEKFMQMMIDLKSNGASIAAYGAPAKGNTLLNYCGIAHDFIDFAVDMNPLKQGKYMPGTRIPIFPPAALYEHKPDYVIILPWNIADEIIKSHSEISQWGGKFIRAIPEPVIL